jgi:predicted transcriptional regulator
VSPRQVSIQTRLARARTADYLTLDECALLVNVSKATIRRRLPRLERLDAVMRDQRIVRIRRVVLLRVFAYDPIPPHV